MPFLDPRETLGLNVPLAEGRLPGAVAVAVVCALLFFGLGRVALSASAGTLAIESHALKEQDASAAQQLSVPEAHAAPAQVDESSDAQTSEQQTVVVFVSGAVASEGVYELPTGSRLDDAIALAGGFAEGAATGYLNRARTLEDGEHIQVPTLEQVQLAPEAGLSEGDAAAVDAGVGTAQNDGLVNINTATADQLQALPGVGPATAAKICAYRDAQGPFASVDDLMQVSGIGAKKLEALRDLACV